MHRSAFLCRTEEHLNLGALHGPHRVKGTFRPFEIERTTAPQGIPCCLTLKILGNVHRCSSRQTIALCREDRQKGAVLNLRQLRSRVRGTKLGRTQISIQLCGLNFEILQGDITTHGPKKKF